MNGLSGSGTIRCHHRTEKKGVRPCLFACLCFLLWCLGLPGISQAQSVDEPPVFSAGFLAGPTSGLGVKVLFREPGLETTGTSADLNISFNGRGFLHVSGHSLREQALPDTPLRLFLGPGMVSELDDGKPKWGISAALGGYFIRGPYEVLFELLPQLLLTPEREGSFGAAVGLRYRF